MHDATAPHPTVATAAVDFAPFAELVDELTRRNADLSATAAMWQTRAAHLEERLKQLTAGPVADAGEDAPQTRYTASGEAPVGEVDADASVPWWRRWWRSLIEGGPQP